MTIGSVVRFQTRRRKVAAMVLFASAVSISMTAASQGVGGPAPKVTAPATSGPSVAATAAAGAGGSAKSPEDDCKHDVFKFEQVIGNLRQQGGNEAGSHIREQLLPAKLQNDILMTEGYCGLSRHLRKKRLIK